MPTPRKKKPAIASQTAGSWRNARTNCVDAWVNDERTLRKSGSKTDPYRVFRAMLEAGDPPSTMVQLLARAKEMKDV
jgi:hypothetical protein